MGIELCFACFELPAGSRGMAPDERSEGLVSLLGQTETDAGLFWDLVWASGMGVVLLSLLPQVACCSGYDREARACARLS